MPKILKCRRSRRNKTCLTDKSADSSIKYKSQSLRTDDKAGLEVSNQKTNRREFLKLSALMMGGGIAAVVLESSLKPLISMSKAAGQLAREPAKGITEMAMVEPVAASVPTMVDPLSIPKFENQLTAPPPVYGPSIVTSQGKVTMHEYTVGMASFQQQMLPPSMNLLTTVWGFGGLANDAVTGAPLGFVQSTPGPTFEAVRNIPVKVKWQNNLTVPYMFPVDPTLHWANPNKLSVTTAPFPTYPPGFPNAQSPVPTVTHLHGHETESYYDGGPNGWFTSNGIHGSDYATYEKTDTNAAVYYYHNTQPATTLWYHDHALGVTRLNVLSGLAGFYLIRDNNSTSDYVAPLLPSGKYEMPLVIQDRTFNSDGSLSFPTVGSNPDVHPYWAMDFLGNTILVNGKVWPNMNVDQGQYRLRLLNASNVRFYELSFVNVQTNETIQFTQIGSDGGYLKAPATLTSVYIAPAERIDILIDFSGLKAGTQILLKNTSLTSSSDVQTVGQIMQFTVTANEGFAPKTLPTTLNSTLVGSYPNLPAPTKKRILTLFQLNGSMGPLIFTLNGMHWDAAISELPVVGTTEEWTIVELTNTIHAIHLHLIQFQVISRQNVDGLRYATDWIALQRTALGNANATPPWPTNFIPKELAVEPYLQGSLTPTPQNEQGWKDTVQTFPYTVTVIRVRFASQDGSPFAIDPTKGPGYVWHCHMLDHEDNEMMRPYKVTSTSSALPTNALTLTAASATAVILLYLIQRRARRKRRQQAAGQSSFSDEQDEARWEEENLRYYEGDEISSNDSFE